MKLAKSIRSNSKSPDNVDTQENWVKVSRPHNDRFSKKLLKFPNSILSYGYVENHQQQQIYLEWPTVKMYKLDQVTQV